MHKCIGFLTGLILHLQGVPIYPVTYPRTHGHPMQCRHISKKSENLGRCGRQNMLRPYLKIWEWEWIFRLDLDLFFKLALNILWPLFFGINHINDVMHSLIYACIQLKLFNNTGLSQQSIFLLRVLFAF